MTIKKKYINEVFEKEQEKLRMASVFVIVINNHEILRNESNMSTFPNNGHD